MNKTSLWKTVFIGAVLLGFLFGIFGIPKGLSGESLKTALQDRIKLGLDLKGGTHLILQVKVNEAVSSDTDRAIETLKDQLRAKNIAYGDVTKPDPTNAPEKILIKGVPAESTADMRSIVTDRLPEY